MKKHYIILLLLQYMQELFQFLKQSSFLIIKIYYPKKYDKNYNEYVPFNISDTWVSYDNNTFAVGKKDGKYYMMDFNEPLSNSLDIELTKDQYDKYLNIIKTVEEEHNKKEEEKISSEKPGIDSSGNLVNVRKNNLDEYLSDFLGKEFS